MRASDDPSAEELIERLGLEPHVEGGWYRETHRSAVVLPRGALPAGYAGDRRAATSILFLLRAGERSARHRVRSEEIWLHHRGDPLELRIEGDGGAVEVHRLGTGPGEGPQVVVPGCAWQSAVPVPGQHGYALVGCVVAPGFEFEDLEV